MLLINIKRNEWLNKIYIYIYFSLIIKYIYMLNKINQLYRLSNLKLHYPKGFAKIFKIPHNATTVDIV